MIIVIVLGYSTLPFKFIFADYHLGHWYIPKREFLPRACPLLVPQPEGKQLSLTMATRQPGEGTGKGKDGGWLLKLGMVDWGTTYDMG